jgi:hypothetical protein
MNAAMLAGVDRVHFVPGGVADPAENRIFVPGEHGGIDALDRASGELLWHSESAQLPLLGLDEALIAAAYDGAVLLRLLDARDGRQLDDRIAAISTPPGCEWWITASRLSGDELLLDWRTVWPQPNRAPSVVREGTLSVRLDDGEVNEFPATPATEPLLPDVMFFHDAQGRPSVWLTAGRTCALAVTAEGERSALDLLCWTPGGEPAVTRLVDAMPRTGYLEHHPSPDTEHVFLLRCNDQDEAGKPAGSICTWLVFSVADGRQVLALENQPGLQTPLAIVGDLLLYIEFGLIPAKRQPPLRMLRAFSVPGGVPVWSHPLPQQPAERLA